MSEHDEAWRTILEREVALDPRGKAGVAALLGVSRSYISRALSTGSSAFKARPAKLIRRIYDLETGVDCPAEGRRVPRAECRKATGPCPTSNILDARRWRACQSCAMRPVEAKESRHG